MTNENVKYAVVRMRGCYDNGETVYAARISSTLEAAEHYADRCTQTYRRNMLGYGGSGGGYRVIEVDGDAHRHRTSWHGCVLDTIPDAK